MRYYLNRVIKGAMLLVLVIVAVSLVGARVDLARNTEVVAVEATATPASSQAISIAPMAVEDEFSSEAVASEETIEIVMPKFVGKMNLSIPCNGIPAYYYKDPDESCTSSIRWEQIYEQFSAENLGKNGFVVGPKAGQEYLAVDWVSHQVAAYGYEVVNTTLVPEEARSLIENDFANFFVGKITRLHHNGKAVTMNVEPYEGEKIHHAVVNIYLGQESNQYVTVFLRDDGVWTLCIEGTRHYDGPQTQPQQTQPEDPAEDVDPAPVWEDPEEAPVEEPQQPEDWDDEFNFNTDPAPVWEDPEESPVEEPQHPEDWDPHFNLNADPAPVWEQQSEQDPAPVWEPQSDPESAPVSSTVSDWDGAFNLGSTATNTDPAPVWEQQSAPVSEPVSSTTNSWDASFNIVESSSSVTVTVAAPAAPVIIESAPAPAVVSAPAAVDNSPAAVWDNPVNESSSGSSSNDSGWDSEFNF